ncbi:MAG: glycosyltransferase [Balneolaceae bacterium]
MEQHPFQFTVLLTTHVPAETIGQLIYSLTRPEAPATELIVIDDASSGAVSSSIRSQIESTNSDALYFIEHAHPTGRGNCLNEALAMASAPFVWAPHRAERFNLHLLHDVLRRFRTDPAAFWVLDHDLAQTPEQWVARAAAGDLPDDSCFIWNRSVLHAHSLFFNPFLHALHGAELALRLSADNTWRRTDPFFVVDRDFSQPLSGHNLQEFTFSALRTEADPEQRGELMATLQNAVSTEQHQYEVDELLKEARKQLHRGDAGLALDAINRFLKNHPDHHEALRLKVSTLEKLRRHVEATELKHRLKTLDPTLTEQAELFKGGGDDPAANIAQNSSDEPEQTTPSISLSIVIPVAAIAKPTLERAVAQLAELADETETELIVIDNACIDDTLDYLEQLREHNLLNIRTITNRANRGFGASVNQGIEAASGERILILHSDVELDPHTIPALTEALASSPDAVAAAPLVQAAQKTTQSTEENGADRSHPVDFIESCCFMIRKECPIRFDEQYGLANLDMDDFCMQIREAGKEILVTPNATVQHHSGQTTGQMGLRLIPQLKWENRARFEEKWSPQEYDSFPNQGRPADRFEQFGAPTNPADPPLAWIDAVNDYLTDEVKTDILRNCNDPYELITIVSSLAMANQRDLMRTLEDRLDDTELPAVFLLLMVHFYFEKNIYSRCRHYLSRAGDAHPAFDMYRLKIAVADKEIDTASELLQKLMADYPACPDLLHLAGELYRLQGDEDEAKSFLAMAGQLNPGRFQPDEEAFELK